MPFEPSQRVQKLPPYLFVKIDQKKKEAIKRGVDVISLGVGDPDRATPPHIIEAAQKALADPKHHQYPLGSGYPEFRRTVAHWYASRFGVTLDPEREVAALIGSKEGIGHFPLGYVNPGDVVLVPEPGYPVYARSTILCHGIPHPMPLLEKNKFLPDLDAIPKSVLKKTKIMFLNYPNNPTSAVASASFFRDVITLAKKYGFLVAHDNAYSEIYFQKPPISFLSIPGAKEVGVEFHSCSKTYNMTGWRIGFVAGHPDIVKTIVSVKDNFDSGAFGAIQEAAMVALSGPQTFVEEMRSLYKKRRDFFVPALGRLGWKVFNPPATFYVWAKTPQGLSSSETAEKLLEQAGVVCTPGNGFGSSGEGYVRFTLTVDMERLEEALGRMKKVKW